MLPATAPGHNDVSETIKALSAQIKDAPNAGLYYQRATEFRAIRENKHAIEDLLSALKLEPKNRLATIALIQLLGPTERSLKLIKHYADFAQDREQQFEASFLLAKYYLETDMAPAALSLCEGLQKLRPNRDPALDLLHAKTHLRLNQPDKASLVLKTAWQHTDSIVLRNNWIDTALTAGLTREVLPIINEEISSSRFRSSWLIRRARAAFIHDDKEQARSDLRAALAELTPRIRTDRPDLTLIADRGLIHALLGQTAEARADLAVLKKSTLSPSSYRLLTEALARD